MGRRAIRQPRITLIDLERELIELQRCAYEDEDGSGRDRLPNGRWPMIYNLAARIYALNHQNQAAGDHQTGV